MAEIQQEMAAEKERIEGTLEALQKTLRHFFVHGYGILLSEAPMQPLAQNLPEVWHRFESELDSFVKMQSGAKTQ